MKYGDRIHVTPAVDIFAGVLCHRQPFDATVVLVEQAIGMCLVRRTDNNKMAWIDLQTDGVQLLQEPQP